MAYQKNPIFEYFTNSEKRVTGTATAALVGKTFIGIAVGGTDQNPNLKTATAGSRPFGVAGWDVALGEKVTIFKKGIVSVTAGAALSAGDEVEVGANGKAIKLAAGKAVGQVLADAASGADAAVDLY
ncbi:capsid cement protein [Paeniglutamicibacter sp. R2-26]|uniref:capsid cement protein n=1 Tax=Paeniglutamicibacter sp. R2-26 TaxID=3144417 RepID=UPI003EE6AE62